MTNTELTKEEILHYCKNVSKESLAHITTLLLVVDNDKLLKHNREFIIKSIKDFNTFYPKEE